MWNGIKYLLSTETQCIIGSVEHENKTFVTFLQHGWKQITQQTGLMD